MAILWDDEHTLYVMNRHLTIDSLHLRGQSRMLPLLIQAYNLVLLLFFITFRNVGMALFMH